jgi:hypothetical protein
MAKEEIQFSCFTDEERIKYKKLDIKNKLLPFEVCKTCKLKRYPCFSLEEWVDYCAAAIESNVSATICCHDCLPTFQDKMKKEDLCRFPLVYFILFDNGLIGKKIGFIEDEENEKQLEFDLF